MVRLCLTHNAFPSRMWPRDTPVVGESYVALAVCRRSCRLLQRLVWTSRTKKAWWSKTKKNAFFLFTTSRQNVRFMQKSEVTKHMLIKIFCLLWNHLEWTRLKTGVRLGVTGFVHCICRHTTQLCLAFTPHQRTLVLCGLTTPLWQPCLISAAATTHPHVPTTSPRSSGAVWSEERNS